MAYVNDNYLKLPGSYLFATVAKKSSEYAAAHPDKSIIKLSIGDVTLPLAPSIIKAMHQAVDDMANKETFKGYAPDYGYDFLRNTIIEHDYKARGVTLDIDDIFISDGAKSDCGNIGDIFGVNNKVAVCDPVYPVYIDTNAMSGRAGDYIENLGKWSNIQYMPCTAENDFKPEIPQERGENAPDIIYLCFPNNPTGTMTDKEALKKWVDYALDNEAIILYDAAYEAYITQSELPHSIYEIEGAKECAIEFHSFSKRAGFTGTRCAYTTVPKELKAKASDGRLVSLRDLWKRRQNTKLNGVSYVIQKAAEAVYSPEGTKETMEQVAYYLENAKLIREGLIKAGYRVWGGVNAPYVWLKAPDGMTSWQFFDYLLDKYNVIGTPGSGFGPAGEGYFRLTGFGDRDKTKEAIARLQL